MPDVTVRVWVLTRPDDSTPRWVYYVKSGVAFDAVPVPNDVVLIVGAVGFEPVSASARSVEFRLSDRASSLSVRVDKRFFDPDGHAVVNATLPFDLMQHAGDDDETTEQEVWDRFSWSEIAETLVYAGYELREIGVA